VTAEPDDLVAMDGRRLGRRAQQTRRKLLDATAELLATRGLLDLTVVEVARQVGISPASFYQYFHDVAEAVLALSEEIGAELDQLGALVELPWNGRKGFGTCRELVRQFIEYWDDNRAVLRIRDLAALEGDERFREVRNESLMLITVRLTEKIRESQASGRVAPEVKPYAAASAMVAMMGRMAAYHGTLEPMGHFTQDDMVDTVARIVYQTVTGRRP
jgi:AcrR family transcriptional regulator